MGPKVLVCLLNIAVHSIVAQDAGDSCEPNQNIAEGTCTIVTECEPAVQQLKKNRRHDFERCGFDGNLEVVCCPRTSSRFGTSSTERSSNSQRIADRECKKILDNAIPALDLHILGGETVQLGEFPHMVALGFDRNNGGFEFDCGGSVISKDYVLTAAHCVDTADRIAPSVVRAGVVELVSNAWEADSDVGIAQILMHPEYARKEKYHDLALLRLNQSLTFTSDLNAVCLETNTADPATQLLITGWGQTSNTKNIRSKLLLKAKVGAVAIEQCGKDYTNWRKLPVGIAREQICAGDPKGLRDTCQGDSGGPLQSIDDNEMYRLVGVTSFGRGCGSYVPGVYTRIASTKYLDWIESVVWPQ